MKSIVLPSILLLAAAAAVGQTNPPAPASSRMSDWTGVWQITDPNKPGGTITLADDSGSLAGVIVFNVMNRQTGQRIAIEPRTLVNPHMEGNTLVFQVRRILKPHLQGDPPASEDAPDPTDIADMKLTASGPGKATLICPRCGDASPTELVKEQ